MKQLFYFVLFMPLFAAIVAKRHVFLENNTPFDIKFNVQQSGDPLAPELWGYSKETIRSGLRHQFLWFPKQNGFQSGNKYRFVSSVVTPIGDISFLIFLEGKNGNIDIKYQVKIGDSTSPLKDFSENYFEWKSQEFTVLVRFIKDDIEIVFHHLNAPQNNGINVLAYNIFMRTPKLFFPNGQTIRSKLVQQVVNGYDVIIFSEAFDKESKETLVASLKEIGYVHNTPNVGKAGLIKIDGGVFISSKHPIISHKEMTFGNVCKGSDCLSDKGVMYAKVNVGNEMIHVFGTHMQAHDGNHNIRVEQMRLIRTFIDRMNLPKNEMVLIGGDMNVEKFKPNEYSDMLNTLKVKSAKFIGLKYTVDGAINRLANTQHGNLVEYLDFILWDPSHKGPNEEKSFVSAICAKSVYPWKQFGWEKDYWDVSDHFPVYAHLEF